MSTIQWYTDRGLATEATKLLNQLDDILPPSEAQELNTFGDWTKLFAKMRRNVSTPTDAWSAAVVMPQ